MSRYWNELLVSCYRKRNLWYLPPANTSTLSDLIPRSSSYGAVLQIGNRHATPVLMLSFYAHLSLTTGQCGATPQRSAAILFARTGRFHIELDIVNASIMHSLLRNSHTIRLKSVALKTDSFNACNGLLSSSDHYLRSHTGPSIRSTSSEEQHTNNYHSLYSLPKVHVTSWTTDKLWTTTTTPRMAA